MSNLFYKQDLSERQLSMVENEMTLNSKSPVIAWLLWIFAAPFGAHRFYLGDTVYAVAMLLLGWITFFIWPLIDAFFINRRLREVNEKEEYAIIQRVKTMVKE